MLQETLLQAIQSQADPNSWFVKCHIHTHMKFSTDKLCQISLSTVGGMKQRCDPSVCLSVCSLRGCTLCPGQTPIGVVRERQRSKTVKPVMPCGPVAPATPGAPVAPGGPGGPCRPCGPLVPVAPGGPWPPSTSKPTYR